MSSDSGSRRFVVEGRVQGVAFRAFTRELATRLGLTGWVRNRQDGTVELVAVGREDALKQLAEGLRQGPPLARVTLLREEVVDHVTEAVDFRIVYR